MNKTLELQKTGLEIARFMRGKYELDEVGDGKDTIRFRRSGKTILTLLIREDRYDLLLIYGKAEREKFESQHNEFSEYILSIYESSKNYHDGKWMLFPVSSSARFEELKPLIAIKKKPNRKPFPRENLVYSKCGMRCDLCVHYIGDTMSTQLQEEIRKRVSQVYYGGKETEYYACPGCGMKESGNPIPCIENDLCSQLKCANKRGLAACTDCKSYPCSNACAGYEGLEPRSISANDVTWAILSYVPYQYGN